MRLVMRLVVMRLVLPCLVSHGAPHLVGARARTHTRTLFLCPSHTHAHRSITAIVECDELPPARVLLAAAGAGAAVLEAAPVAFDYCGRCCSALRQRRGPGPLRVAAAGPAPVAWDASATPADFASLHRRAGLGSFLSVPVADAAGRVAGALMVAARRPNAFAEAWWPHALATAAGALLPHLRAPHVARLCAALASMEAEEAAGGAAAAALRGAAAFMRAATHLPVAARLGLVYGGGYGDGGDGDRVIIVEPRPAAPSPAPPPSSQQHQQHQPHQPGSRGGSFSSAASEPLPRTAKQHVPTRLSSAPSAALRAAAAAVAAAAESEGLAATDLPLPGTLLGSALALGKACFVSDCALYFQRALQPATDIFTPASRLVSALVVVPLGPVTAAAGAAPSMTLAAARGESDTGATESEGAAPAAPAPLGGVYFTLETPHDFASLQETILSAVALAAPMLRRKLAGRAAELRDELGASGALPPPAAAAAAPARQPSSLSQQGQPQEEQQEQPTAAADAAAAAAAASSADGGRCTASMVSAVQRKLAAAHAAAPDAPARAARYMAALRLERVLGKGGFGICYAGRARGRRVAVKVLHPRRRAREAMKDAVEMAVLSHVRHPGIVAVYETFADMVEDFGGASVAVPSSAVGVPSTASSSGGSGSGVAAAAAPLGLPRYRPYSPDDAAAGAAACSVVVMEYCDLGTLRDAARRGMFLRNRGRRQPGGSDGTAAAAADAPPAARGACACGGGGEGALDAPRALRALLDVARAVEYLHERRLLHCDLKLDNVLLRSDAAADTGFACKLADFGLTKLMNDQ